MVIKNLVIASLMLMLFASAVSLVSPAHTAPASGERFRHIILKTPDGHQVVAGHRHRDSKSVSRVISHAIAYAKYEQLIDSIRWKLVVAENPDDFTTASEVVSDLERLISWVRVDSTAPFQTLGDLSLRLIASSHSDVQLRGLELVLLMPPKRATVVAVIALLDGHHDGRVVSLGITELLRHPDIASERDVLMLRTLEAGARSAAYAVASQIDQLLTPANVASYESVLARLPPDSRKARTLKARLEQFHVRSLDRG